MHKLAASLLGLMIASIWIFPGGIGAEPEVNGTITLSLPEFARLMNQSEATQDIPKGMHLDQSRVDIQPRGEYLWASVTLEGHNHSLKSNAVAIASSAWAIQTLPEGMYWVEHPWYKAYAEPDQPFRIQFEALIPIDRQDRLFSTSLRLPPATIQQLRIQFTDTNTKLSCQIMQTHWVEQQNENGIVYSLKGNQLPILPISWYVPEAYVGDEVPIPLHTETANNQPLHIEAEPSHLVIIGEQEIDVYTTIIYRIVTGTNDDFVMTVPTNATILEVTGALSQQFSIDLNEQHERIVHVVLDQPVAGSYEISLYYKLPLSNLSEIPIHLAQPKHVLRQIGHLGVAVTFSAELEIIERSQLVLIDARELPSVIREGTALPIRLASRFTSLDEAIVLNCSKLKELLIEGAVVDRLEAFSVVSSTGQMKTEMQFHIRNDVKQFLRIKLEQGQEIQSATRDDSVMRPLFDEENQEYIIPLSRPQYGSENYSTTIITLVYHESTSPFPVLNVYSLVLPQVNLPISESYWHVYPPHGERIIREWGTVRRGMTVSGYQEANQNYLGNIRDVTMQTDYRGGWAQQMGQDRGEINQRVTTIDEELLRDNEITEQGALPVSIKMDRSGYHHTYSRLFASSYTIQYVSLYSLKPTTLVILGLITVLLTIVLGGVILMLSFRLLPPAFRKRIVASQRFQRMNQRLLNVHLKMGMLWGLGMVLVVLVVLLLLYLPHQVFLLVFLLLLPFLFILFNLPWKKVGSFFMQKS
jgi:hypothetical protein